MRAEPTAEIREHAAVAHMFASDHVRAVSAALGPHARIMPLKGTLTGKTLYVSPSERTMVDCDLLLDGVGVFAGIRLLEKAGLVLVAWCSAPGVATLARPGGSGLALDVHFFPLLIGYGGITTAWMMAGASVDSTLFGVPVYLPEPTKLFAHLVASPLKDDIFRAQPTLAEDAARVLRRYPLGPSTYARALREVRLARSAWVALEWMARVTGAPELRDVQRALALTPRETAKAARMLERRRAWCDAPRRPLVAKIAAHAVSDASVDRGVCLVTGAAAWVYARTKSPGLSVLTPSLPKT